MAARAFRFAGLAVGFGLSALAAYQRGQSQQEQTRHMASRGDGQSRGRLDATGEREVVFCHACSHEWYRDQHGLICPQCDGEIIEIVSSSRQAMSSEEYLTICKGQSPERSS